MALTSEEQQDLSDLRQLKSLGDMTPDEEADLTDLEALGRIEAGVPQKGILQRTAERVGASAGSILPASKMGKQALALGKGFVKGIRRKDEDVQGVAESAGALAGRYGPQIAGGAALGALAGGPPGAAVGLGRGLAMAGAEGLGAGGAELAAQLAARGLGGPKVDVGEAGKAGVYNAAGSGLLKGVAGVGRAIAKTQTGKSIGRGAVKVGGEILRIGPSVRLKYGEAVAKDPSILMRAITTGEASKAYQAFENYTGLQGLGSVETSRIVAGGSKFSADELEATAIRTAHKVLGGQQVSPQELYLASQAVATSKERMIGASGGYVKQAHERPFARLNQTKQIVDGALERVYPEYAGLRTQNFEAKARAAFDPVFPQNANQSPNLLSTRLALGAVLGGVAGPSALMAIPAMSPRIVGTGIKAGVMASKAISPHLDFLRRVAAARMAAQQGQP